MSKINSEKTISANSHGIIISYGDAKKHQYVGYENNSSHIKKIQQTGTAKYQKLEEDPSKTFNIKQKALYSEAMYGFKAFTAEEMQNMSEKKKLSVTITYTKAQRILNRWKQSMLFEGIDSMLNAIFPKSPVIKQFTDVKGYNDDVPKREEISFKDLGISQKSVIDKLMEYNILPENFYSLT